jgi:prepilin-type N-terminal cleavage/methylation domain-containing protein
MTYFLTSVSLQKRGFTLIEVSIVLGLVSILAMMTSFSLLSDYTRATHRIEKEMVLTLLREARARAQGGVCQSVCTKAPYHGVAFSSSSVILFEQAYDTRATTTTSITEFPHKIPVTFSTTTNPLNGRPYRSIFYFEPHSGRSVGRVYMSGAGQWMEGDGATPWFDDNNTTFLHLDTSEGSTTVSVSYEGRISE